MPGSSSRIGTLRETPLHAALKEWCARPGDLLEAPIDGFVVDVLRDDRLIEIQTSGFSALSTKFRHLLRRGHRILLVHPVARDRTIVKLDPGGTVIGRRLSPRHGGPVDLFSELVSFPDLVAQPGLEIEVVMTVEEEVRVHAPGRARRRRGWMVVERRLVEVVGSTTFAGVDDLVSLLPDGLPDPFTTLDLAVRLGRPRRLAQQMTYCLREMGGIEATGKRGNAIEYRLRCGTTQGPTT